MLGFFKKLFGLPTAAEEAAAKVNPIIARTESGKVAVKTARTKDKKGKFIADDPRTPQNEAWADGKAPVKKSSAKPRKTTKK